MLYEVITKLSLKNHRNKEVIYFDFKYNRLLIELIRSFHGVCWSKTLYGWYIARNLLTAQMYNQLKEVAEVDYSSIKKEELEIATQIKPNKYLYRATTTLPKGYLEKLQQQRYSHNTIRTYTLYILDFKHEFQPRELEDVTKEEINTYIFRITSYNVCYTKLLRITKYAVAINSTTEHKQQTSNKPTIYYNSKDVTAYICQLKTGMKYTQSLYRLLIYSNTWVALSLVSFTYFISRLFGTVTPSSLVLNFSLAYLAYNYMHWNTFIFHPQKLNKNKRIWMSKNTRIILTTTLATAFTSFYLYFKLPHAVITSYSIHYTKLYDTLLILLQQFH